VIHAPVESPLARREEPQAGADVFYAITTAAVVFLTLQIYIYYTQKVGFTRMGSTADSFARMLLVKIGSRI